MILEGKRMEDIIKEQAVLSRNGNIHISESEELVVFEFDAYLNHLYKTMKEELEAQLKKAK